MFRETLHYKSHGIFIFYLLQDFLKYHVAYLFKYTILKGVKIPLYTMSLCYRRSYVFEILGFVCSCLRQMDFIKK